MSVTLASKIPTPIHIIQDSRYAKKDGWQLYDISLCSSGNIAVSGCNYRTVQSFVCIYGSTLDDSAPKGKPTLFYHRQFTDELSWQPRYIAFMNSNSTQIVTCRYGEVHIIDYNRNVVVRSCRVESWTGCLSVSENQIFIGKAGSDIVNIYNHLNRIKSIRLKGIGDDWPRDIAAAADRLYVCTTEYGRAIVYNQDSGSILTEYTAGQRDHRKAWSIAVNIQLGLTAVLWRHVKTGQKQIIFYIFSENKSFLTVNVDSGVSRIRISDQGKTVTGNESSGEVRIYKLASLFSYSHLKESVVPSLGRYDCEKLTKFFAMNRGELKTILISDRPAVTLLLALEEKGVIQPSNVKRLEEAFLGLKMSPSLYYAVNMYQKLRDQVTSYDRFLAILSTHLTSSLPAQLCDYFHVCDKQKSGILSSQNPGLFSLLVLDEMGIMKPSDVGCLEKPLNKFRLVQAVAKIHQYQVHLKEEKLQLSQKAPQNLEDKRDMFVEFVKRKIKEWYETMTPVPWKKSCQWKSTDLFVGGCLILNDSKTRQNVQNIDEHFKLNYTDILSHEKLKSELRIILEGESGTGKTMLLLQLAYEWSEGKIDAADILIFLPLKIVEDKTLIQAVREIYIPANVPISEKDIETILASKTGTPTLLLDGLEEYSPRGRTAKRKSSEVLKIMKKKKISTCKVVITTRSHLVQDLPECPLLKMDRFGETEMNLYIGKLLRNDTDKQQKLKLKIHSNPILQDLLSVPLLFVLAIHNIEKMSLSEVSQLNKVSTFMSSMISALCSANTVKHNVEDTLSEFCRSEKMTLEELAFNGLCKGYQQLSWQKYFIERNVECPTFWVDSGILVLEEGFVVSESYDQDVLQIKKEEENEGKKKEKQETKTGKVTLGSSPCHNMPKILKLSNDLPTTGLGVSADEEVFKVVSNQSVPLLVQFHHKVIQEWFAATFFSSIMKSCTSAEEFQNNVGSHLRHISPTDLHYVLRFTSYLHPPSCHHIMNYLLGSYRKDGHVPPYILNCIFLCFNEHNDVKGSDMKNTVTDVCKEVITIHNEDSRLLQQAKSSLLEYASSEGVIIEKLKLRDVISSVNGRVLILNSGVELIKLDTVKVIEVSHWDRVFQEDGFKNILKTLTTVTLHKELCPLPKLDELTSQNVISKDQKVEWQFGHSVQSLDSRRDKRMISLEDSGSKATRTNVGNIDQVSQKSATLSVENTTTNDGGLLRIPYTDVKLFVPPGALEENNYPCMIRVSIIPPGTHHEVSKSFCSNSSTIVELLPNNLTFRLPVRVTLPHCLQLKKNTQRKAKIFMSHHERDAEPRWEEVFDHQYILDDKTCTIWLKQFCWIKCEIDDEIVEAKRIEIYTAAHPMSVPDDIARLEVGYHLSLPGAGEMLRMNPSFVVGQRMPYLFLKEGKHPLKVLLSTILPQTWTYSTPEDNPQEIPFRNVASSLEFSCPFILQHKTKTRDVPTCIFKASQAEHDLKLQIRPEAVTSQNSSGSSRTEVHHRENAEVHHQENVETQEDGINLPRLVTVGSRTPTEKLRRCFMFLKKNLAGDWRDLGRCLKLVTEDDIIRLGTEHKDDIEESIYQMLLIWERRNGALATLEILIGALNDICRKDIAEMLASL